MTIRSEGIEIVQSSIDIVAKLNVRLIICKRLGISRSQLYWVASSSESMGDRKTDI
jgi:hypothetical protein